MSVAPKYRQIPSIAHEYEVCLYLVGGENGDKESVYKKEDPPREVIGWMKGPRELEDAEIFGIAGVDLVQIGDRELILTEVVPGDALEPTIELASLPFGDTVRRARGERLGTHEPYAVASLGEDTALLMCEGVDDDFAKDEELSTYGIFFFEQSLGEQGSVLNRPDFDMGDVPPGSNGVNLLACEQEV